MMFSNNFKSGDIILLLNLKKNYHLIFVLYRAFLIDMVKNKNKSGKRRRKGI